MPSKQSDFIILTDKDGINVWLEAEDDKWHYQIIRDDQIVTDNMGNVTVDEGIAPPVDCNKPQDGSNEASRQKASL